MSHERLERFVDKAVTPSLVVLILLLLAQIFLDIDKYEPIPTMIDTIIVAILFIDLYFKWQHVRDWKKFAELYWWEILAAFPFYLSTRMIIAISELLGGAIPVNIIQGLRTITFGQRVARTAALRLRAAHFKMLHRHMQHKINWEKV